MPLTVESKFQPAGDQPKAIREIVKSFQDGEKYHTLIGATGTGKTFTMACVLEKLNRSSLIIAPNKTLAAQLYSELKSLFAHRQVGFFISYYDYYQPEAYLPSSDTYIAKDSSINDDIEKMRHQTTSQLFEEDKVVIVSSVSCIYGLGSPDTYEELVVNLKKGQSLKRKDFLTALIEIQYTRQDHILERGSFRVRGDQVDLLPSQNSQQGLRVEFWGDEIENIWTINADSGAEMENIPEVSIYPNSHYLASKKEIKEVIKNILTDLGVQLRHLKAQGKMIEYERLEQRTMRDVETLEHLGFCPGIENYSRYLSGRMAGMPPPCLLDYFPDDFLTIIDESHITVPQISGMYRGDQSRKQTLVNFGFRLPSALDNRPLNFQEFIDRTKQVLFVSATPSPFELKESGKSVSQQMIRPTGLLDPEITVRNTKNQIEDLHSEMQETIKQGGRVLITTLTKKMAEDITEYYESLNYKIRYLHSDIDTLERTDILRDLRRGTIDVLVGINLLREGLDLPEVMLVGVLDADKEGFLRSQTSLTQTVGRAARNEKGRVIFYGEKKTKAMKLTIEETARRRKLQIAHNKAHGITPKTIIKDIPEDLRVLYGLIDKKSDSSNSDEIDDRLRQQFKTLGELIKLIDKKSKEMKKHAKKLEFEKSATLRDEIKQLKAYRLIFEGKN